MKAFGTFIEQQSGSHIEYKCSPNCWSASLEGGFDAYKARLTKRARKIVREAEFAIESRKSSFEIAATLPAALECVDELDRMHQARWKERGIDGCFATQEFSQFLRGAVVRMWDDPLEVPNSRSVPLQFASCGDHQRVHIGLVRIRGSVAAGAICFCDRNALAMYLVGMNPEFADDRPGWTLNTCFIQHAIALGCDRFDFMRGDEEYIERLRAEPTAQHRWLLPSPRFRSQIRNVAYRTAVGVKEWWFHKAIEREWTMLRVLTS